MRFKFELPLGVEETHSFHIENMEIGVRDASSKCFTTDCGVIAKFTGTAWISETEGYRPFYMDIFTGGNLEIHASLPYFYKGNLNTTNDGMMRFRLTKKMINGVEGTEDQTNLATNF